MALDPTSVFDSILNKTKEIMGNTPVYVAEIPPDEKIPTDSRGNMIPFVSLSFGGPIRSASDRNLVSVRRDVNILYVTADIFAPTATIARQVKGRLIEGLTGFAEGDMTELTLTGLSLSLTRASNVVRPTQYVEMQSWQCRSNLTHT